MSVPENKVPGWIVMLLAGVIIAPVADLGVG